MVDHFARRAYPVVVLGGIACTAYFQAAGLATLLADAYLPAWPPRTLQHGAPRNDDERSLRKANIILARNPFDSVTGPLSAAPDDGGSTENAPPAVLSNPLEAPECADVVAHAVTESTDPTWSATVLVDGAEHSAMNRRVGDSLGRRRIAFIGYNRGRNSPSVWLSAGSDLCQVVLFGKAHEPTASHSAAAPRGAELPMPVADRIRRVSDTEFHLDRSVVDEILGDQMALLQSIRVIPDRREGAVVGLRLVGIRPGSLLSTLGLKSGDRLERINGFDVTDPGKALEAYAHLRAAETLSVQISREGRSMSILLKMR